MGYEGQGWSPGNSPQLEAESVREGVAAMDAALVGISGGYRWKVSTATTEPPADGEIRVDDVEQTAATRLWATTVTADGVNASYFFRMKPGDTVTIMAAGDPSRRQSYALTGSPVGKAHYVELPVVAV